MYRLKLHIISLYIVITSIELFLPFFFMLINLQFVNQINILLVLY